VTDSGCPMASPIHPTASVDPAARLAEDVEVGPYAIVGPQVVLGRGCRVHAHAVIDGCVRAGERNVFHAFSVVGGTPQDRRYNGGDAPVELGDDNVVREHVTVHGGTRGRATRIRTGNLLMVGCHVAHDVDLGSHCVVANGVQLAGHAVVEDYATFGGLSAVAQFVCVGEGAFVAGGAMCERDVPPFVIVQGDRARVRALNVVGLRRRGVPAEAISALRAAFRAVYVRRDARPRAEILSELAETTTNDPWVMRFVSSFARDESLER
jgi:UDP-N-acetylglucosamine acyltransferase